MKRMSDRTHVEMVADPPNVMRQAFRRRLLWSKQFYHYDLNRWPAKQSEPSGPEAAARSAQWSQTMNGAIRRQYNADVG